MFLQTITDEINGVPANFEVKKNMIKVSSVYKKFFPVQKPTAVIFYEKIRSKNMELSHFNHQNMKNKFNYLKKAYMRAINWRNSTGAGVNLHEGETIEGLLIVKNKFTQFMHFSYSRSSSNDVS